MKNSDPTQPNPTHGWTQSMTNSGPSVCLSLAVFVPKRLNMSSNFIHSLVANPFYFFYFSHTTGYGNISTETPYRGRRSRRV